ncbi:hypothetical protein VU05_04665 [Desulfobulbus sp. F1]|nr:hypothetical protein [Desulfobulbus sp. F1]
MKRIIAGLMSGVAFGMIFVGLDNASGYENERHEYRNVYPNSGYTYNNSGYTYHNDDRYERRVIVRPSYNNSRPGVVYNNVYPNNNTYSNNAN